MKLKTEIIEAETHEKNGEVKKTVNGRQFARFKTTSGWLSCFDTKIIETLKLLVGKMVVVDIKETLDDKGEVKFRNINGIYPDGEQEEENGFEDAVKRTDAQEAKAKPKNGKSDATFYTSYAKDILVAYMENIGPEGLKTMDFNIVMAQAVRVVNNAKEIFS